MKKILRFFLKLLIFPLSYLPLNLLYSFAPFLTFVLYKFPGYRTEIVRKNLRNSFPGKSADELQIIEKKFYRYFSELILEILKLFTISRKELKERFTFPDLALIREYDKQGKQVICVVGHYGNWEWAGASAAMNFPQPVISVYKPLHNEAIDRLLREARERTGSILVPMKQTLKEIVRHKNQSVVLNLISDQTPSDLKNSIPVKFMDQTAPVFQGIEKLSKKFNMPVVFCEVKRIRRGRYEVIFHPLTEDPGEAPEGEITRIHTRFLEKIIRKNPEFWLWTHRRWKHSRLISDKKS